MLKIVIPLIFMTMNSTSINSVLTMLVVFLSLKMFFIPIEMKVFYSLFTLIDTLSSGLIILTIWVSVLMLLASNFSSQYKMSSNLNFLIMSLMIVLIMSFFVSNLMAFYILFEASLIPTLMIVLGWGYQPERLQASMYLMMYTITASLPFLVLILMYLSNKNSIIMFSMFSHFNWLSPFVFMYVLAFLVKMPMYITHLWLPKAHVEAPVAGSMILAGVLLKLGGYGMIRIMNMMKNLLNNWQILFTVISLWGAFVTSMICIRQQDMKSLIAYSSVGHMGLLIAGLMSSTKWGIEGSITMMIAHGLASPALFALANMSYETNKTRSLLLAKGMLFLMPIMSVWWFVMSIANMAAPPTLNLAGEIMLLIAIVYNHSSMATMFGLSSFLAAAYSLLLYTTVNHGKPMLFSSMFFNSLARNSLTIIFHMFPLYVMILFPTLFVMMS